MNLAASALDTPQQASLHQQNSGQSSGGEDNVMFIGLSVGPTPVSADSRGTEVTAPKNTTVSDTPMDTSIQGVSRCCKITS